VSQQELDLVKRLVQQDDCAWEMFCRDYSGPLLSFIRLRFACSQDAAEEIVHMAFIRCVKSIRTFDPQRGRLFDWLSTVARNEAYTLLRKNAEHQQRLHIDPETCQHLEQLDRSVLPEEHLAQKEVQALVLRTVMALNGRYRQVLTMKYLEGRRVLDIAATLGQSEKAIESLLTRSRQAFRDLFQRNLEGANHQGGGQSI
jgi:RNA polymerase sigma factor (sigma-70 family)